MSIVECVPNFSEGRRPEVIKAIIQAITSAAPITLLDHSSDPDHNRTVVTFVGSPDAVEKAAFAGIETAARLIDLNQHKGEHPRIGATDVVPFIPLRDTTMETCVAIAKRLGAKVASDLNIPVYLYESAATRPDRENLENIRRGQFEGLREAIKTDPERAPDFGPRALGSAGATVIGARPPLIAYNVYLNTDNVEIAKQIAKAVRHSSGGLRFVKALGLLVEGKAQVSMNLTYYERTPIHRVTEMVRREAERFGAQITYTELVGLIPDDALIDAARWYLQLDAFEKNQLLDRRLQSAAGPSKMTLVEPPIPDDATRLAQAVSAAPAPQSMSAFIGEVAAGTPAPGGGSVSALAGALAGALAEMVARLTMGKKKYESAEVEMHQIAASAANLRSALLAAVDRDAQAYGAVMNAYKMDKMHPSREAAVQTALRGAAEVPLEVMRLSLEVMRLIRVAADRGNANAVIDASVGAHMAHAAVEGAALNVRVNLHGLRDQTAVEALRTNMSAILHDARALLAQIVSIAETRSGLT